MKKQPEGKNTISSLMRVSGQLLSGFASKATGLWYSYRLTRRRLKLEVDSELAGRLVGSIKPPELPNSPTNGGYEEDDDRICRRILEETAALNLNNVTRTAAYWRIFASHPELHWALLAHMVSRNGGWSMTDLRGQWLPQLLDERMANSIFKLLEACNSLIFGDAYPQLRLYSESKRAGRGLSHLLSRFGVSAFMRPFWDRFRLDGNSVLLTEALIVNEQHYIQSRVVEDDFYKHSVFDTLTFRSQPLLQLNQIVFPLRSAKRWEADPGIPPRLVGRVLEHFEDLRERIEFGKCLYGILFGYPEVLRGVTAFAAEVAHTGSRQDYWPGRFTPDRKGKADASPALTDKCVGSLQPSMWFSPALSDAWTDQPFVTASKHDWLDGSDPLRYLKSIKLPRVVDMTHEHVFGQNKLQAAVLLERSLMNGASSLRTGRG